MVFVRREGVFGGNRLDLDLLGQVVLNVNLQVGVLLHLVDRQRRRAVLEKDDKSWQNWVTHLIRSNNHSNHGNGLGDYILTMVRKMVEYVCPQRLWQFRTAGPLSAAQFTFVWYWKRSNGCAVVRYFSKHPIWTVNRPLIGRPLLLLPHNTFILMNTRIIH